MRRTVVDLGKKPGHPDRVRSVIVAAKEAAEIRARDEAARQQEGPARDAIAARQEWDARRAAVADYLFQNNSHPADALFTPTDRSQFDAWYAQR